jgi:hypothetical protein
MRRTHLLPLCFIVGFLFSYSLLSAQTPSPAKSPEVVYLIKPARVFDGESAQLHDGWVVLVRRSAVGNANAINAGRCER